MLKLFVSHLGFGSLGIRGCYQRLFRTTHGHGTVTARSTPAPPFAKHALKRENFFPLKNRLEMVKKNMSKNDQKPLKTPFQGTRRRFFSLMRRFFGSKIFFKIFTHLTLSNFQDSRTFLTKNRNFFSISLKPLKTTFSAAQKVQKHQKMVQ